MPTNWVERISKLAAKPLIGRIDAWEGQVSAMPEAHRAVQDSPVRFEIMKEKMKRDLVTITGVQSASRSVRSTTPAMTESRPVFKEPIQGMHKEIETLHEAQ